MMVGNGAGVQSAAREGESVSDAICGRAIKCRVVCPRERDGHVSVLRVGQYR